MSLSHRIPFVYTTVYAGIYYFLSQKLFPICLGATELVRS